MKREKTVALILGGYVNGYSIIKELFECRVKYIWLFDYGRSLARKSNKITGFSTIEKNPESLKSELEKLRERFEYIVVYPTDDLQLELLYEISDEITEYCFLPFNKTSLKESLDKNTQYRFCEEIGVPYPKTLYIAEPSHFDLIENIKFPVLMKPNKRDDLKTKVFRNIYFDNMSSFKRSAKLIEGYLSQGIHFLMSEFIPGDDTNIYAYTGYRSKDGKILNEWIGKKLNQFPDLFGVFSSASNEAPEIIRLHGRKLLEGMDIFGIAEPEFKFDYRDGEYKLMEINLRSMMWHRTGNLSGVNLQYTQWCNAIGCKSPTQVQKMDTIVHYVYMKHEILNLFYRKNYLKSFVGNVFGSDNREFAVFDKDDIKPFLHDLTTYPRGFASLCLKPLFSRSSRG